MDRILVLRIFFILLLAVLVGRLYQLQLLNRDNHRYVNTVQVSTTRHLIVQPRRGEILANDGVTRLAESVPIANVAVLPGRLPSAYSEPEQRAQVLGTLSQIIEMSSTLTISPVLALDMQPHLRDDLTRILGNEWRSDQRLASTAPAEPTEQSITITVPPIHTLEMLAVTKTYSDVLTLQNPIETILERSIARGYEPLIVKENIDRELALALSENSSYLSGVIVTEGYQRRYPQSAALPSLSHLLGYVGRINRCELVMRNPSPSWLLGLSDVVRNVTECGFISKEIDPHSIGLPIYRHDDYIGKDGLEGGYEDELRGEIGVSSLLVDALERPVSNERTMQPVRDGSNLVLTIDLDFQRRVEQIMRNWIAESERRRREMGWNDKDAPPITSGVAIALDPNDGRVLAMVSLPTYDNNVWIDRSRSDELQNLLAPDDPQMLEELTRLAPLTNRAIAGRYPPGSTLKQFVGLAALQKGVIAPNTLLYDPGQIALAERNGSIFTLPNSGHRQNGLINVSDALKVSSNVFFASISGGNDQAINIPADSLRIRGLTIDGLAEGLEWFGFGRPTGIQMPGEVRGRVPTPVWKSHALRGQSWTTGDTYNTAIGQGFLEVTPLQLVVAAAAVANEGTLYRPQLVQRIVDSQGNTTMEIQPDITGHLPIDPAYYGVIKDGMRRSVTEGANVAARPGCSGIEIAGKTGTAEFGGTVISPEGRAMRRSHSWFVGYAPYDNPQIAVVVLLEGTGDLGDGSATLAAPAVTQVMQAYFRTPLPESPPPECPDLPDLPQ